MSLRVVNVLSSRLSDDPDLLFESILSALDIEVSFVVLIIFYNLINYALAGLNKILAMPVVIFAWQHDISELCDPLVDGFSLSHIYLVLILCHLTVTPIGRADPLLKDWVFVVVAVGTKSSILL